MVEALVRRVEPGLQRTALQPAAIVPRIAIVEAVGQQEVDDLVLRQPRAIVGGGGRRLRERGSGEEGRDHGSYEACFIMVFIGANCATNWLCSGMRDASWM